MKTKRNGGPSSKTRHTDTQASRRHVLAGLAAVAVAPVKPKPAAGKGASTVEEALLETYAALHLGAKPWDPIDAKADYMDALRPDFAQWFDDYWDDEGTKVKWMAAASGMLAALIAQGLTGGPPGNLTKKHVFLGSAIVQGSKACSEKGKPESRGRFCQRAPFGSVDEALGELLKPK